MCPGRPMPMQCLAPMLRPEPRQTQGMGALASFSSEDWTYASYYRQEFAISFVVTEASKASF